MPSFHNEDNPYYSEAPDESIADYIVRTDRERRAEVDADPRLSPEARERWIEALDAVDTQNYNRGEPFREPVAHYETPGGIETIDYIRSLGLGVPFSIANGIKYLSRVWIGIQNPKAAKKNATALRDLKKARTYINFAIEELESEAENE